jgi:acetylornithine deacetylase
MCEGDLQRVLDRVEEQRDAIIELQQDLVRFDSVNMPPWGKEGPCQAFVAKRMRSLGLDVDIFAPDSLPGIQQHPAWLHGRDYSDRPNVVGTLTGSGGGPSLHLSAHADVVPIGDRSQWITDPFGGQIIDGKIYGRGALDDKDGIAAMLAALEVIRRSGYRLRGDLILSSYTDEEFGGGNGLLAVVQKGYRGDAAINCDGVGYKLWVANTGGGPFRVLVQGSVQSSHPTASMWRVQATCKYALTELSRKWRSHWRHPLYPEGTPWILRKEPIELRDWEEGLREWSWLNHGPACGVWGYATTLPGQERHQAQAQIAAAVQEAYEGCGCADVYPPRVEYVYRFMDACEVPTDAFIITTLGRAVQALTGQAPDVTGGLRSDLYMLALHGQVPAVSFGVGSVLTGSGSAHEPNERIDIDGELLPLVKILALAMMDWCGYER